MSDRNTINTEGGDANIIGSQIGGRDNMIVGNQIQLSNSLNNGTVSGENVQKLLDELSIAVKKMNTALLDEEKTRVNRALETLIDEAKREKPDKKWWSVSVEGLIKAAENVGKIGKPVLEIVAQLVPILTQRSA